MTTFQIALIAAKLARRLPNLDVETIAHGVKVLLELRPDADQATLMAMLFNELAD